MPLANVLWWSFLKRHHRGKASLQPAIYGMWPFTLNVQKKKKRLSAPLRQV